MEINYQLKSVLTLPSLPVSYEHTKVTSYVVNILGPRAQEKCVVELKSAGFFGIGSDASNKGNKKLFPVTVRYFSRTEGLKDGFLDFYNDNNETSQAIAEQLKTIIEGNELNLKYVSFYSVDNASVNYGKYSSVFQKLKQQNNNIVQANCNCDVMNNTIKYALKAFSFDVESFAIIHSCLQQKVRCESFMSFCNGEQRTVVTCINTVAEPHACY